MEADDIFYTLLGVIFGGIVGLLFRKSRNDRDELKKQITSLRREVDTISSAIKRKD